MLRLKECLAPSGSERCVFLLVVRGVCPVWLHGTCVESILRGVCTLVCVRCYHVGPEGCVSILVMKGVFVSALVLRGVCDHVGFLVLCVCVISEVSVSWLLGDGVPLWSLMVAS